MAVAGADPVHLWASSWFLACAFIWSLRLAPRWARGTRCLQFLLAVSICCRVPADPAGGIRCLERVCLPPQWGQGLCVGGWVLVKRDHEASRLRACTSPASPLRCVRGAFAAHLQGFAIPCAALPLSAQHKGADLQEQRLLRWGECSLTSPVGASETE